MPTERFDKLPELKKNRISDAISEAFMHRNRRYPYYPDSQKRPGFQGESVCIFSQQRRYAVFFAVPDAAVYLGK